MGWFDEQIRQRIKHDDEMFADAYAQMANLISGKKTIRNFSDHRQAAEEAVGEILKYYHIRPRELPENITDVDEILEFLFRPSGIMRRTVRLPEKWYEDAVGAMLGTKKDGTIVALLPGKTHGYGYRDPATGEWVPITKNNEEELSQEALCFYRPFPLRKLRFADIFFYMIGQLCGRDYALMLLGTAGITVLGLVTPKLTQFLYGVLLSYGSMTLLAGAVLTLFCVTMALNLISVVRAILNANIATKIGLSVESAMMMRVLSLPVSFFKQYSSGELASRLANMNNLCGMMFDAIFSTALTALFSLIYIGQVFQFTPALVVPAAVITLLTLMVTVLTAFIQMGVTKKHLEAASQENGMVYALIGGVTKIKNAGAEKRAFARWSRAYVKAARFLYQPPMFLKLGGVMTTAISMMGTIVMYGAALSSGVTVADYMAFLSAYGMISGAFTALAGIAVQTARIKPVLELVEPILQAEPEVDMGRPVVSALHGSIELNNISFRYDSGMPNVLDNLSLKIRPGQYVAIVGKTGCGKSTLLRLLLGFEKPQKGAVYYDGRDLASMDLRSLRRKIGVVMQNGKLFQGDIYSNITISAPNLSLEEAWQAAELAGMAEDIRQMPMGMHTLISEGQGGISGGQRQRLLIARAIASKPRILMFDEATSALDNLTQKTVSDSLEKLKCTRIVIAHRLSTIRHCDRIIVLDQGHIVEDGTYEELLEKNGAFAELVERQQPL